MWSGDEAGTTGATILSSLTEHEDPVIQKTERSKKELKSVEA